MHKKHTKFLLVSIFLTSCATTTIKDQRYLSPNEITPECLASALNELEKTKNIINKNGNISFEFEEVYFNAAYSKNKFTFSSELKKSYDFSSSYIGNNMAEEFNLKKDYVWKHILSKCKN